MLLVMRWRRSDDQTEGIVLRLCRETWMQVGEELGIRRYKPSLMMGEMNERYRTQRIQAGDENDFRRASLDKTQENTADRGTEEHALAIPMAKSSQIMSLSSSLVDIHTTLAASLQLFYGLRPQMLCVSLE